MNEHELTHLYHVSAQSNRESILCLGLDGRDFDSPWEKLRENPALSLAPVGTQPKGTYFYEHVSSACAAAARGIYKGADIWKVDITGIELLCDPESQLVYPIKGSADRDCLRGLCTHGKRPLHWYTPQAVSADRLTLLTWEDYSREARLYPKREVCRLRRHYTQLPVWKEERFIQVRVPVAQVLEKQDNIATSSAS